MKLRIRRLILRVVTERGPYSRDLGFDDGLTVLRGKNSRGKSTCLMSILYCLGLEGMLTAKRQIPLPHAVTDYLEDGADEIKVVSSDVTIVLENGKEERLTVRRQIKGDADPRLIRTWRGNAVTEAGAADTSEDFFVRDPGAAQREAGFHRRLADYVGWTLPDVPRFDGGPVPLYLETIFPLLFIEQKRGWLGLQARMPTYLGIRDAQLRAVEFLLGLRESGAAAKRARLENQLQRAQEEWRRAHSAVLNAAHFANGEAVGVPGLPGDAWPEAPASIRLPQGTDRLDIAEAIVAHSERLHALEGTSIPSAAENATALNRELAELEASLADLDALASKLDEDLELAQLERTSASSRVAALQRDLQRNKDAQKLRRLGSMSRLSVVKDRCPTCHQVVAGHLLDQTSLTPMSLDDNIAFIEEMVATVNAAEGEAARRVEVTSRRIAALTQQRADVRSRIRRLKRSLVQDERAPSLAEVEERVRLENQIERLRTTASRFNGAAADLRRAHEELARLKKELAAVHAEPRSPDEIARLKSFERSFVEQVTAYGLTSLRDAKLSIDPESYRPRAEGMPDLEFELSGSDLIRAIWAYYVALLETARNEKTNHPGFLIVDEPQQQGTEAVAVGSMLRRATLSGAAGQQVIVASSEAQATLQEQLHGVPFRVIDLDSWALTKIEA